MPAEQKPHFQAALELYRREADLTQAVFGRKDAFLGPWTGADINAWSPQVRQREQALLLQARELETQAIGELEKVLASAPA
ncbi:MAG: hypothetical protein GKR89_34445 [Candidatus Latescibacteria bacterium]|nr:hypothetical protein [Candidatus Latescibacterota bacterium]